MAPRVSLYLRVCGGVQESQDARCRLDAALSAHCSTYTSVTAYCFVILSCLHADAEKTAASYTVVSPLIIRRRRNGREVRYDLVLYDHLHEGEKGGRAMCLLGALKNNKTTVATVSKYNFCSRCKLVIMLLFSYMCLLGCKRHALINLLQHSPGLANSIPPGGLLPQ